MSFKPLLLQDRGYEDMYSMVEFLMSEVAEAEPVEAEPVKAVEAPVSPPSHPIKKMVRKILWRD
jgi:hypothetical protein